MKRSFLIILFSLLISVVYSRITNGTFTPAQFVSHNQFYYLGKMDYGIGFGTLDVQLTYQNETKHLQHQHMLQIGILIDQNHHSFHESTTCKQKQALIHSKQSILLSPQLQHAHFEIQQTIREHLWYIFVFNCEESIENQQHNFDTKIQYKLTMINNNSHFGEDEQVYVFYWILTISSILLFIVLKINNYQISKDLANKQSQNYPLYFLTIGNFLLMIGFIFKLVHLYFYSINGRGFIVLNFGSLMLKALSQGAVLTILIVISWGWTINYYKCYYYELIIPCGISGAFVHMLLYPLSLLIEGDLNEDHHYDHIIGNIILYYRIIILGAILFGLFSTYFEAHPKSKSFIMRFGIFAIIYNSCDIVGVVFSELFLPKYMQKQVMIGVSDVGHLVINAILVVIFSKEGLGYSQIKISQQDQQDNKLS